MKTLSALFVTSLFVMLLSSGCYTKFYNPNMEVDGPYSANELYSRYDSSAIDTTLTREDWAPEYYPDNGWYNSGGYYNSYPRTRWGFDFYNFSPGYYNSYYGYYDYYGSPWWYNSRYNNNSWWYRHGGGYYGGSGSGTPGEPPSQRDGRRERDPYTGSSGASTYQPSGGSSGGAVYTPPAPAPVVKPTPPPDAKSSGSSGDSGSSQKRTGKRR